MNTNRMTCDPERIELFLQQKLSDEEQTAFESHLDDCDDCRRRLEAAAAGDDVWSGVRDSLRGRQMPSDCLRPGDSVPDSTTGDDALSSHGMVLKLLAPTDDDRSIGRLGTYEVVGVVGSGGMGVVLKAFDAALNRYVAIKVLAPHLGSSGTARKRFLREAQAAAAVVHDNVIEIHGVADADGLPYLVMPYVRGPSLQRRLDGEGPLAPVQILRIGMQAAAGLAAAHAQGLVHRDVKPANILLDDGVERVKLTDFGLARAADDASLTKTGIIAGTPQYMSPEQARGEPVDQRSDLFSLGSVLYAMCTGRAPFRAETSYGVLRRITDEEPRPIREINPDVPDFLCQVVARLMSKQPGDRFQSAREVAELLEQCLAHVQQPTAVPLPNVSGTLRVPLDIGTRSVPDTLPDPLPKPRKHFMKRIIAMITAFGIGLLGMFLLSGPTMDIAGRWSSEEWGQVVLKKTNDTEYTGTYSDTDTKNPSEIHLRWSRIERQFTGTWREGDDRFGDLSVSPAGNELHVAFGADDKCKVNPGTPHLKAMTWRRADPTATTAAKSDVSSNIRLEQQISDPKKPVRTNAEAAPTMPRATAANSAAPVLIFSPRIERVTAVGNKVVIQGMAPANAKLNFYAGDPGNGWSCTFPKAASFTATLEKGPQGLNCRVVTESGKPILNMDGVKQIGNVVLSEGQLVFHDSPPYRQPMTIGEWTAKSGRSIAVGVSSSPSTEWGEAGPEGLRIRLLVPSKIGQGPRLTPEDFKAVLEVSNTSNRPVILAEQSTAGGREMVADDWLIGLGVKVIGENHLARTFMRADFGGNGSRLNDFRGFSGLVRTIGAWQTSAFKINLRRLIDKKEGTNLLALRGAYQLVPVLEVMVASGPKDGLWRGRAEGKPVLVQISSPEGKQASTIQPASDTPNAPQGPLAARMREVLKQPTQLEFVETPLPDVVDYLTDLHHFPFTVSDDVEKKDVTINVKGVALGAALRAIEDKSPALQFVVVDGGIFLMKRERAKREDFYSAAEFARSDTESRPRSPIEPNRMVARKIRETLKQPTQLEFVETPAIDVVDYLKDLHHIEFQISEKLESTPLTLQVKKGATGATALRAIEDKYPSLEFVVRDYGILLTEREIAKREGYYSAVEFVTPVESPGRPSFRPGGGVPVKKMSYRKMSSGDYFGRGYACYCNREYDLAIADYQQALAINPDYANVYDALAGLQATCPDKRYRDGKKAVENASKALQLTEEYWPDIWPYMDTLAAAYAESGDFEKAKQSEEKAIELAADVKEEYVKEYRTRLELYKQGKPYREEPK